MLFRFCSKFS